MSAMSTRAKVFTGIGIWLLGAILLVIVIPSEGKDEAFQPQEEFKLDNWVDLQIGPVDMSINKAVVYLFLAAALTSWAMIYIAKRMQQKPNKVQTAMEAVYGLTVRDIVGDNMSQKMAAKWFPFIATLFFFIWFSNFIGLVPLPFNTHEKVDIFGLEVPSLALYAATANVSIPLVLTLFVFVAYQIEGIRAHGFFGYFKSWIPSGTPKAMRPFIFAIEAISQFVRIISLSVRLFANILAGHLLILFMGGGLAVLLGLAALGWLTLPLAIVFFIFEIVLVATLQAFIFSILTSIYFGEATAAEGH